MKNWTSKYKPEEGLFPSTGMLTSVGSGPKVPTMRNGGLLSRTVTCSDCGWSWKAVDGGKDSLTCHKCGGIIKMKHGGQGPGDDELAFQQFFKTLPTNLRKDSPDYNIRGYWNALGKPTEFDYSQPKEDDGYYHASSRNPQTGEILKAPFHPTFKQAISEDRKAGYFPIVTPDGKVKTVSGYDLKPGQSVYANGGDISLPNVYPNAMIPKYGPGGVVDDSKKPKKKPALTFEQTIAKGKKYNENWMNSPMYAKMLRASTGSTNPLGYNPEYYNTASDRKFQLANSSWGVVNKGQDPTMSLTTAADANSFKVTRVPEQTVPINTNISIPYKKNVPNAAPYVRFVKGVAGTNGNDLFSDAVHEFSHISDVGGMLIPEKDLDLMDKYKSNNYLNSPLFQQDKRYYSNPSDITSNKKYVEQQQNWLNYVNDPTETRARLNDFRMRAKEQGLYDPFTQAFDIKYLKNYKPIDNNKSGWDPIDQLRGTYSDEEIADMLNKISKTDNSKPQTTAKYGGSTGNWTDKYKF